MEGKHFWTVCSARDWEKHLHLIMTLLLDIVKLCPVVGINNVLNTQQCLYFIKKGNDIYLYMYVA